MSYFNLIRYSESSQAYLPKLIWLRVDDSNVSLESQSLRSFLLNEPAIIWYPVEDLNSRFSVRSRVPSPIRRTGQGWPTRADSNCKFPRSE